MRKTANSPAKAKKSDLSEDYFDQLIEHLKDPREAAAYLEAALRSEDTRLNSSHSRRSRMPSSA